VPSLTKQAYLEQIAILKSLLLKYSFENSTIKSDNFCLVSPDNYNQIKLWVNDFVKTHHCFPNEQELLTALHSSCKNNG
jgi:hypothetical protein